MLARGRMRVCTVSAHFPPEIGGIQNYACSLSLQLEKRSSDFFAAAVPSPKHRWGRASSNATLAAGDSLPASLHRIGLKLDGLAYSGVLPLRALCKQQRTDVAIATHWSAAAALQQSRRLCGYPRRVLTTVHGREVNFNPLQAWAPARAFYDRLRQQALLGSDRLLPVSQHTGLLLRQAGVPAERIHVVHNGVDTQRFARLEGESAKAGLGLAGHRVLLTVARLVDRKGVDLCLRAFAALSHCFPDVVYVVVGDGPERRRLEAMAVELGVDKRVRFEGEKPHGQVDAYFAASDVFMLCPRQCTGGDVEGFPLVYFEAAASGTPLIGSRSGGVSDAIIDGQTGFLVPPESPEAIAAALGRLLDEPALAQRLGAAARQHVLAHGSWETVARLVLQHCEQVL